MKMAKATEKDLSAALALSAVLEDLGKGYFPSKVGINPKTGRLETVEDDEPSPTFFNEDDHEHLKHLHRVVKECVDQGGLFRVVFGMSVVLDPNNAIVDPDLDHLELHPRLRNTFDLLAHVRRQREFSERTFGPGTRSKGVVDHIRKELIEIEAKPDDLAEWVDVILLAIDGAWRAGYTPEQVTAAIDAKQTKNEGRTWPDWRTADPNKAIEHDRTALPGLGDSNGR